MIAETGNGNGQGQTHIERTYQYEFDRHVLAADCVAMREADIRAAK
jgi:hypothetical protein